MMEKQERTQAKKGLLQGQDQSEFTQMQQIRKEIAFREQDSLPQIFQLGGNKKLNLRLFKHRKEKLEALQDKILIQCQDLGKFYELKDEEPVVALRNITLKGLGSEGAVKKGQFVVIRGPSGGGKTTFLNLLGTIDKPTSGFLRIQDQTIQQTNKDSEMSILRRDKIGIVFQTFNLLALMTAYQNIELPMRIKGRLTQKQMKQRTFMLLKKVGLSQRADHLPSQLSGGQQQRVAIARSLANSPSIVLLDQPTGDLDSKSTIEVMNLILEINNFGYHLDSTEENNQSRTTIVMVTHNQDLQCYGDRIIFFEDGTIKRQALNEFQFALDAQEYSKYLNNKI